MAMQHTTLCLLLVCLLAVSQAVTEGQSVSLPSAIGSSDSGPTATQPAHLVLFDHDGGVDDFITLLLLLSNTQRARLIGITIIEGDCHADVAANTTFKLLDLLQHQHIPVAVSSLPAVNPFPAQYRSQGLILDVLPMLNQQPRSGSTGQRLQQQSGQEFFAQLLLQQERKVTIIATGPLSNLAYALQHYPQVADKIERVWWMGGALRVRGNVYQPNTDGSAEWNAFWDPAALGVVWSSSVPLTLVPLDGTNKVPITPDLVYKFGPQSHNIYSALAGTMYAPVVNWVFNTPGDPYYAWDALTAACMVDDTLCKVEHGLEVAAVLTGPAQGATVLTGGQHTALTLTPAHQPHKLSAAGTSEQHVPAAAPPDQLDDLSGELPANNHLERVLLSRERGGPDATSGSFKHSSKSQPAVHTVQGTDVSQQLSDVKVVSAVTDVDAQAFHSFLLHSLRQ